MKMWAGRILRTFRRPAPEPVPKARILKWVAPTNSLTMLLGDYYPLCPICETPLEFTVHEVDPGVVRLECHQFVALVPARLFQDSALGPIGYLSYYLASRHPAYS